jgi:hypothetical protein
MNKADTEVLKFAIKKFWKEKSDADLALSLNTDEETVKTMRISMGLELPKGNESLKDFARRYIMEMSERDKREFIKSLPADLVWKMSEGNPHSSEDSTVKHILPTPIMSLE